MDEVLRLDIVPKTKVCIVMMLTSCYTIHIVKIADQSGLQILPVWKGGGSGD